MPNTDNRQLFGEAEVVQKTRINIPTDEVADRCRRHHIRKLVLFGSVLRDDFRPDSDIDRSGPVRAGPPRWVSHFRDGAGTVAHFRRAQGRDRQ